MSLLNLTLSRSRYLFYFLLFLHIGAAVSLFLTPLPTIFLLAGIFIISLSFLYYAWYKTDITQLHISEKKPWKLINRMGQTIYAELLGDSIVTQFFILLNFKQEKNRKRLSLAIFPDMLSQNDFRRLQVYLRTNR